MSTNIQEIVVPKIEIDPDLLEQFKTFSQEEGQVILHCTHRPTYKRGTTRICKTSYLVDKDSDHMSKLIHAECIPIAPDSMKSSNKKVIYFTLIFSGLPKSCTRFTFIEVESGTYSSFNPKSISRNGTDVYFIKLN